MRPDWMRALSVQFEKACKQHPDKPLMLICDIDGTILDMRHMILTVLHEYERTHLTDYFARLQIEEIDVHENQLDLLLKRFPIPEEEKAKIIKYYLEYRWKSEAICEMHRPFRGVLDVIRWFQLQPNTTVGLVTGRPEKIREDTLRSLNKLGKPYRVSFSDEFVFMNPGDWEEEVQAVKIAGLKHFQDAGFHVFAFIDNEPANLKSLAKADPQRDVLLLHANTIFESQRTRIPRGTVRGKEYRLSELIPHERALPSHVQLVWHGVNNNANLRQFLASDIRWAEVDAQLDRQHNVILRHDPLEETTVSRNEEWLTLDEVLGKITATGRAVKIDMKAGGVLMELVMEKVARSDIENSDLWFNGDIERVKKEGFKRLAKFRPGAIIQCPIDFLAPMILAAPERALDTLKMLTNWGINRFSLSWNHLHSRDLFDQLDQWGFEVNFYNVHDLESFLQAVLLLPKSVTSDFNFPKWEFYGNGSGKGGIHFTYRQEKRGSPPV